MRPPVPDNVKAKRARLGMTQREAGQVVHCSQVAWGRWESGARKMHPAFWELFNIKTKGKS